MTFGEKLKALREEHGMTQDDLAAKLYVSRTAISKWETNRSYPSIDSLKAIQQELDVYKRQGGTSSRAPLLRCHLAIGCRGRADALLEHACEMRLVGETCFRRDERRVDALGE